MLKKSVSPNVSPAATNLQQNVLILSLQDCSMTRPILNVWPNYQCYMHPYENLNKINI